MEIKRGYKFGTLDVKGGGNLKKWATFYIILKDCSLSIYQSQEATEPSLTIPMNPSVELKPLTKKDLKGKHEYGFQLANPNKKLFKEPYWFASNVGNAADLIQDWMNEVKDSMALGSPVIFSIDLQLAVAKSKIKPGIPDILYKCVEYLKNHVTAEGLFRLSGSLDAVMAYKDAVDNGRDVDFATCDNPHNISNLLKLFLRELPDPLLTYERYDKFVNIGKVLDDVERFENLVPVINNLPQANKSTLKFLLTFLKSVSQNADQNKMTSFNLAVVFGPTIMKAKEESLATAGNNDLINCITEAMIKNAEALLVAEAQPQTSTAPVTPGRPDKARRLTLNPGGPQPGIAVGMDELADRLKKRQAQPIPDPKPESPKSDSPAPAPFPALKPSLRPTVASQSTKELPIKPAFPALKPSLRPTPQLPPRTETTSGTTTGPPAVVLRKVSTAEKKPLPPKHDTPAFVPPALLRRATEPFVRPVQDEVDVPPPVPPVAFDDLPPPIPDELLPPTDLPPVSAEFDELPPLPAEPQEPQEIPAPVPIPAALPPPVLTEPEPVPAIPQPEPEEQKIPEKIEDKLIALEAAQAKNAELLAKLQQLLSK